MLIESVERQPNARKKEREISMAVKSRGRENRDLTMQRVIDVENRDILQETPIAQQGTKPVISVNRQDILRPCAKQRKDKTRRRVKSIL